MWVLTFGMGTMIDFCFGPFFVIVEALAAADFSRVSWVEITLLSAFLCSLGYVFYQIMAGIKGIFDHEESRFGSR